MFSYCTAPRLCRVKRGLFVVSLLKYNSLEWLSHETVIAHQNHKILLIICKNMSVVWCLKPLDTQREPFFLNLRDPILILPTLSQTIIAKPSLLAKNDRSLDRPFNEKVSRSQIKDINICTRVPYTVYSTVQCTVCYSLMIIKK